MIQRRAARYTLNQYSYHSSVSAMLQHLCWPTLQQRRNLASVTMLYKLQHQLVSISNLHYLVPSRDHKFIQPLSSTNYHLYSFFPRTIRLLKSDVSTTINNYMFTYRPAVENQKIKCNEPMGYTPISYVIGKRNDGTLRIMMP